jgi:hypothetical protein
VERETGVIGLALLGLAAAVPVAVALVWSAAGIVRAGLRGERLRPAHVTTAVVCLLLGDVALCLGFYLAAGLSHSEAAKAAAPWRCVLSSLGVLGVPALAPWLLARRAHRGIVRDAGV